METAGSLGLERIDECRWRLPQTLQPGMRVSGVVFADEELLDQEGMREALQQVMHLHHS